MAISIVGDVHGKISAYIRKVRHKPYSIQIGDMGFDYTLLHKLNPKRHKFFGGNHDNYDLYYESSHSLGDYGKFALGRKEFYFIRGAFSIDWQGRITHYFKTGRKCWWEEEQLHRVLFDDILGDYEKCKPSVVLTHSCPSEIASQIGKPDALRSFGYDPATFTTNTQELLSACLDAHKPDLWIFGHFHNSVVLDHKGVEFRCLDELEVFDYE